MTDSPLLTLPLPFVTALITAVIAVAIMIGKTGNAHSRLCFSLLFAVFSLQTVLVGVRFGYGFDGFAMLQRSLPFAVGPLIFLGFRSLADPNGPGSAAIALHGGAAAVAIASVTALPLLIDPESLPPLGQYAVDLLVSVFFLVYILLLVLLYRRGPDAFEAVGLGGVASLRAWLLAAVVLMIVMLAIDSVIALDFLLSGGRSAASMIALGNLIAIPTMLAVAVLYPRRRQDWPETPQRDSTASQDHELLDEIETLFAETGLHRDPDLSLGRLARRLAVPARQVSSAINGSEGCNVSQYVNRRRVEEAAALLAGTDRPVGEIMESVGFRTKSNFNREFKRVMGCSPVEVRARAEAERKTATRSNAAGLKPS